MTTEQMAWEMVQELNRPEEDDLFVFPDEYYKALSKAHRYYRRLFAAHRPDLIYDATTVATTDGGETFLLTDDHYGEMLLFRSPGPPSGRPMVPSTPEGGGHYWQEGRTIRMLSTYDGTLYVRWVPATVTALDGSNDSTLPVYCDDAILQRACFYMAQKPGFLGNPEVFKANSQTEWAGDPSDPADMGVLGIIMRQSAHQAYEGVSDDVGDGPWWRF
jgi:hypothetical protein